MRKIGKILPKTSSQIKASRIGIGFECLDRKMWNDTDEVYECAIATGAKYARVQTGWNRTELIRGQYDFTWLDRTVDKLLAGGIQPWLNLGYGNILYTDAQEPDACGWVPLYSEDAKTGWRNYIAALVQHYRDRVSLYEVWNEPYSAGFWLPGPPSQSEYVELVKMTAEVIRGMQPTAKIIGGNTGTELWFAPCIEEYMKLGLGKYLDIYSYHRYRVMPEIETPEWIDFYRAIFKKYGADHLELWQGEAGFPSVTSETEALAGVPMNEKIQAKLLLRSLMTDLYLGNDYTSYFTMSDFRCYYKNGFRDKPNYFGLLTTDTPPRPKQSYHAFRNICTLFDCATRRDKTVLATMEACNALAKQDRYLFHEKITSSNVVTFERNDFPLIVWWQKVSALAEHPPYPMNVIVWSPTLSFRNPVLIDPLDGAVYQADYEYEKPDFRIKGLDLPLKDYPMILTDLQAIGDCFERI